MANNIVLKTYKGRSVTPQDDAIIYETAIPLNGVFKGCTVSYARGNVLRVSQGFGMIKGRFFEVYESEVDVRLADGDAVLSGRIYVHMDLSNVDEPIQILTQTGTELTDLQTDEDVNFNNTAYDMELATFTVTSSELSKLEMTVPKIESGSGGSGGGTSGARENVSRNTEYYVGDMTRATTAPGWATLVCITAGVSALTVPSGYAKITKAGDTVTDGTCVFKAYNLIESIEDLQTSVNALDEEVADLKASMDNSGLKTVVCSVSAYAAMEGWDDNTMYFCYEASDPSKITRIYKGESRIYADAVKVTYQSDTDATPVVKSLMERDDAIAVAPTVTKEDYTFAGWKATTDADGDVLSEYVIGEESAVTLYAVFKNSIEIGMHPNSGTLMEGKEESIISVNCYYNNGNTKSEDVIIPDNPYEKKGMSFSGWNCSGEFYKPGIKGNFKSDGMLMANWIDTEYDFPFTGSYQVFNVPADGIYELEVWGAEGGTSSYNSTVTTKGGKGGHAKGYKMLKKGEVLYVFNGGKPTNYYTGGVNGGTSGSNYTNSRLYGSPGGGATHVAYLSGAIGQAASNNLGLIYSNRDKILIIAGGGGGGGMKLDTSNAIVESHEGGGGGGDRGEDGSGGALGGRQIAVGSSDSYHFGTYTYSTGSSSCYSGGGGGWFAGEYGSGGESGAGGSGNVSGVEGFTYKKKYYGNLNEVGVNEGNGYSFIRYVEVC